LFEKRINNFTYFTKDRNYTYLQQNKNSYRHALTELLVDKLVTVCKKNI